MEKVNSDDHSSGLSPSELLFLILIQAIVVAIVYPSGRELPDSVGSGVLFIFAFLPYSLRPNFHYLQKGTRLVFLSYIALTIFDGISLLRYTGSVTELGRQVLSVLPVLLGGFTLFRKRSPS